MLKKFLYSKKLSQEYVENRQVFNLIFTIINFIFIQNTALDLQITYFNQV